MTRLEKLTIEREIMRNLSCVPVGTKEMIDRYYDREISAIKDYDSSNPESLPVNLIRIRDLLGEKLK